MANTLERLAVDIKAAVRAIRRNPLFAALVVATLTIAIGSSTAMFALVSTVLLHPLPFPDEHRLVRIRNVPEGARGQVLLNVAGWQADVLREQRATFENVVALEGTNALLRTAAGTKYVSVVNVGEGWKETLGTRPIEGRMFRDAEQQTGRNAGVAVISYELWRHELNAAPLHDLRIVVDERPLQVVGVFPRAFHFPYVADVWVPARTSEISSGAVFGRLGGRTTIQQARERVAAMVPRLNESRSADGRI